MTEAKALALSKKEAIKSSGKGAIRVEKESEITKVLTFLIGEQVYGIEIPYIIEIIGVPSITHVPCYEIPSFIKGIINVRSKVVPVVNVRACFGKEEIAYDERACTIIVAHEGVSVGLIVDEVLDVSSVSEKHLAKTPELNQVNNNKFIDYILEMSDGVKLVLDVQKLIFDHDVAY
ncbi:MAG: chemotaxis protein CheW [Oscillospiraceae bacterium]|nr:chemotaxis protein CheW [Oscillospiraceae bacterium]